MSDPAPTSTPTSAGNERATKNDGGDIPRTRSKEDVKPSSSKPASKVASRAASKASLKASSKADIASDELKRSKSNIAPTSPNRSNSVFQQPTPSTADASTSSNAAVESESSATETVKPPLDKPPVGEAIAPGNPNAEISVDGIMPLFLTTMTQDLFKIKGHEDLTPEKPIKVIPKADFLADIQARLVISDFHPAKSAILVCLYNIFVSQVASSRGVRLNFRVIQEYPGDELLIQFDPDFKYGQNFFLYISPAAVDAILRVIFRS
jgi:hypothetical protein